MTLLRKARGLLGVVALAALVSGSVTATASSVSQDTQMSQQDWQGKVAHAARPASGCYKTEYPKVAWQATPCATPPAHPQIPRTPAPRPLTIGNGTDVSAQAPMGGFISSAVGSFDAATVAWETGRNNGVGPVVNDSYSLQLNTNFFASPTACAGSPNPGCQAWEQFVYANDGSFGVAFIQYWILTYNAACPGGWNTFMISGDTYCYRNSPLGPVLPSQPATNLTNLKLAGEATASGDSVTFFVGATGYTTNGINAVNAAAGWQQAEFGIYGNAGGSQATFDPAASLTMRTRIDYGGTDAPDCVSAGYTGETNNLSFPGTAPTATGPGPALRFFEDTVGGGVVSCDAAIGIGDVHETTVAGLKYDFQARGDFELAQVGSDFEVQSRHMSGAPTWPQASMNQAIATRMGKTRVAVCPGPKLVVDGKPVQTPERPIVLPTGVQIALVGGAYVVTDASGNSVTVTPRFAAPNYFDVKVGIGTWPTTVKGLLGNPNNDINLLGGRDGTVYTVPLTFDELYQKFGDSWRVKPLESLLLPCGNPSDVGNPTKPFGTDDIKPDLRERALGVCRQYKVAEAWLDACTLDVAVLGANAAQAYVGMAPPKRDGDKK